MNFVSIQVLGAQLFYTVIFEIIFCQENESQLKIPAAQLLIIHTYLTMVFCVLGEILYLAAAELDFG